MNRFGYTLVKQLVRLNTLQESTFKPGREDKGSAAADVNAIDDKVSVLQPVVRSSFTAGKVDSVQVIRKERT